MKDSRYKYSDHVDSYHSEPAQTSTSLSSFDSLQFTPSSGIPPEDDLPSFLHYSSGSSAISDSTIYYSAPSSACSTPTHSRHSFSHFFDSDSRHSSPHTPHPSRSPPTPHPNRSIQSEITDKANDLKAQATAKYQAKDYAAAAKLYTYALSYVPSDYVCFSASFIAASPPGNRAACYISLSKTQKALKDALKVIELNPGFPRGYTRAGKCYFLQGDVANARKCYEKGAELARQQPGERTRYDECVSMLKEVGMGRGGQK